MATVDPREVPSLDKRLAFIVGTSAETVRRFYGAIEACGYHLAPVAPVPAALRDVRDKIVRYGEASAAAEGFRAEGLMHPFESKDRERRRLFQEIDAVLAVIAPPVDVETVMAMVETLWENGGCSCPGCLEIKRDGMASIRALLEGRAG